MCGRGGGGGGYVVFFFFFKQKTAYEMCGRNWSSDVCSSDLFPQRSGFAEGTVGRLPTDSLQNSGLSASLPKTTAHPAEDAHGQYLVICLRTNDLHLDRKSVV